MGGGRRRSLRRGGRAPAALRGSAPDGRPFPAPGGVRAGPGAAPRARVRPRSRGDVRGTCAGGGRPVGSPGLGSCGPSADAGGTPAYLRIPGRPRRGRALGCVLERGAGARRHRPAPTLVAHRRPRTRVSLRGHRRGRLGPGRRTPPAPGRRGGHGVREERRRGRDVARECVPGLPGRRTQSALQLLLRADERLGLPLLGPARTAGLPPVDREGSRAGGVHPLPQRGDRGPLRRGRRAVVADRARRRRRRDDRGRRRDRLRRGTAQPPVLPRPAGPGALRGPVLPLGRVGRHGGAGRSARRRHRERRQRGAVRAPPGGGGRPPRRVSAHCALVAPDRQLRQPVPAGVPRTAPAAPRLRTLGPAVAILAAARGTARGGPGRPRVGPAHRSGERRQRLHSLHAARRPAGPGRRRRALREDGARTSRLSPNGRCATTVAGRPR